MKKIILLFTCAIAFVACQKQQYASSIPAPKFEYYNNDRPQKAKKETESKVVQQEVTPIQIASTAEIENLAAEVPAETATQAVAVSMYSNSNSETATVSPKKTTLKERMISKIIAQKVKKANQQTGGKAVAEKTNIIALVSGIAALLGIALLLTSSGAFTLLLALGGIIGGFIGRSQIKKTGEKGKGWALTGIFGGFAIVLFYLLIVVVLAAILL
jgi:hypothetical protein